MYVCVDKDAQTLPGLEADNDVTLLYHTSVDCRYPGIPCPPYVHSRDLSCVDNQYLCISRYRSIRLCDNTSTQNCVSSKCVHIIGSIS